MVISSKKQTSLWRSLQKWYINGKHNECEKYQKKIIKRITTFPCEKTFKRINYRNYNFKSIKQPKSFEWSENFDIKQKIGENIYYYNLKFVCNKGGHQIRTLRGVYHFIKAQEEVQKKYIKLNINNVYFINILDGDFSFTNMYKLKNYSSEKIFIGDMNQFKTFYILGDNKNLSEPSEATG